MLLHHYRRPWGAIADLFGEVQKANQVVRTLITAIERERVSATRHVLHLEALKKYQKTKGKTALTLNDIEKLFEEGTVIEKPDSEMKDQTDPGPSANGTLTPQSLSFEGFTESDSDPDYVPEP